MYYTKLTLNARGKMMPDKRISKTVRIPETLLMWVNKKMAKSGRTFSAEVIHQLTLVMERVVK